MPKRVSILDIAREVGAAVSTVSRALNDHPSISDKTKDLVRETAARMNYIPNSAAANLKSGRKKAIGVIVPRISRHFFASAIEGIEDFVRSKGYDVMICQNCESAEGELRIVNSLKSKVDGIIASLAYGSLAIDVYNSLIDSNIPLVIFDRTNDEILASTVKVDDFKGAKVAVRHLLNEGNRRIFHFAGFPNVSVWRDRMAGYKSAMNDFGIEPQDNWYYIAHPTQQEGRQFADRLLSSEEPLPDAIFFTGDYAALGAMMRFKECGVRVPEDIAIVGFANEPFCDIISPTMTSIEQFSYKMGQMSCQILFELLDGEPQRNVVITPELIVRESSCRSKK